MKGCRPLTPEEIKQCLNTFDGSYYKRNKLLFLIGIYTGFRISELLSLRVKDVYKYDKVNDSITVNRAKMKGKREGRTVPINDILKEVIQKYIDSWEKIYNSPIDKNLPLFLSQKMDKNGIIGSIKRRQAIYILQIVFNECKLDGKLASHTMRKTFAKNVHESLGKDILLTQKAMGHKDITSTTSYLSFDQGKIDNAIKDLKLF